MIEKLIPLIRQKQDELASSAMQYPAHTDHMLRAGQWQGLQMVLEMVDEILNDSAEVERRN